MADVTVDKVIVELEAKLGTYNAKIKEAGELFDRVTAQKTASADKTQKAIEKSAAAEARALERSTNRAARIAETAEKERIRTQAAAERAGQRLRDEQAKSQLRAAEVLAKEKIRADAAASSAAVQSSQAAVRQQQFAERLAAKDQQANSRALAAAEARALATQERARSAALKAEQSALNQSAAAAKRAALEKQRAAEASERAITATANRNARARADIYDRASAAQRRASVATPVTIRAAASSGQLSSGLRSAAGTLAAGASVTAIAHLADGYTRYTNQLKVAGLEGANLAKTQDQLFAIAQRYGVELESLGGLYARTSQGAKELGASQDDLVRFTTGVAAALKVQGGSAASTSGAILQLTQALGGAIVRAEEFNSINEGARPILQAVANNIDRFGGSVAKLRNEVIDGKVTSQEFFQAFLKGSVQLEAQAAKANLTIAASFQVLNNALGKYIGEADANFSATQKLSAAITSLSNNLDTIIPALTVLIGLIGARYAASAATFVASNVAQQAALTRTALAATAAAAANARLVASGGAATVTAAKMTATIGAQAVALGTLTTVARGAGAALLTAFGGPVGLAIAAIAAALYLVNTRATEAAQAANALNDAHKRLDPILQKAKDALDAAAAASGKVRDKHLEAANAAFALGEAELDAARKTVTAARARVAALGAERSAQTAGGGFLAGKVGNPGSFTAAESRAQSAERALAATQQALVDLGYRKLPRGQLGRPISAFNLGGGDGGASAVTPSSGGGKAPKGSKSDPVAVEIFNFDPVEADPNTAGNAIGGPDSRDNNVDGLVSSQAVSDALSEGFQRSQAIMRDTFADTFADGVEAALDGDLKGFLIYSLRSVAREGLKDIGGSIWDAINGGGSGGSGGGFFQTVGSAIGSFLSPAGTRKAGGPVVPGQSYRVHEGEVFQPSVAGRIVKDSELAGGRGGGVTVIQNFALDAKGAVMTEELVAGLKGYTNARAAEAGQMAYSRSMRDAPAAVNRKQIERG